MRLKKIILTGVIYAGMIAMFSCCSDDAKDNPSPDMENDGRPIGCTPPPQPPIQFKNNGTGAIPPNVAEKEMQLEPNRDEWGQLAGSPDFLTDLYYGFNITRVYMRDAYSPDASSTLVPIGNETLHRVYPDDIDAVPVRVDADTWICDEMGMRIHREMREGQVYITVSVPETKYKVTRPQIYDITLESPYPHCLENDCIYCRIGNSMNLQVWKISPYEWKRLSDKEQESYSF